MIDKKNYLDDARGAVWRTKRLVEWLYSGLLVEYAPEPNNVAENKRYSHVLCACERATAELDALCDALDFLKAV